MFLPFMVQLWHGVRSLAREGFDSCSEPPSEGWYEKGHTSGQYPDALSVMGHLEPCSSLGRFMVWEFFLKKGNKPSGTVE
jgi:hypothetical protein